MKRHNINTVLAFFFIIISFCLHAQDIEIKNGEYYLGGGPYTGTYKEYYSNSNISCELPIVKGKLDGVSIFYYEDGTKKESRSYSGGLKNGLWSGWDEKGNSTAEASYKNDMKDGNWYIWDEKGHKRYEMHYKEGAKTGTWNMWDENGVLIMTKNY
jgi:antitoxin component YwqK of YwqJK toxin-antitoxin module